MTDVSTSSGRQNDTLVNSRPVRASTSDSPMRGGQAQSSTQLGGGGPILDSIVSPMETTHQATRLTARLNASAVTDKERNALLAERATLLKKTLTSKLTRKEEKRLEYVSWSLDRIEDAKSGPAMDRLEAQIDDFRRLADRILGMQDNLENLTTKGNRRR